ncbi:portal protein [Bradyrhizobium sp. HKCCYLS3077]|uniref:portal protein n=1 Tax=Bradyrhizobium sp. HKCCYLS3077 TaxID=3420761 RepID=UPI003EBCEFF5
MPRMSDADLKTMLAAEKADALAAVSAARLAEERADAMDYYLGNMKKDMPAQEGRSRAVSTDVADTVEGLMPHLMDIFAGSDEVVRFEPVGPEDEAAASQETDYVNHVFMQQNPGFMILYSFIKDALLSKVGIVKVWWEEREEESRETYYDLTEDQFALLAQSVMESDGAMRIVAHTMRGPEQSVNLRGADNDAAARHSS